MIFFTKLVQRISDRVCHDHLHVTVVLYVVTRSVNMIINWKLIEVLFPRWSYVEPFVTMMMFMMMTMVMMMILMIMMIMTTTMMIIMK